MITKYSEGPVLTDPDAPSPGIPGDPPQPDDDPDQTVDPVPGDGVEDPDDEG